VSEGSTAPATKNDRSHPISELLFRVGQGDLSEIYMRMDLVVIVIWFYLPVAVIDTAK
jgi:hypothetical protein